jgi:hypothetical protein
MGNGKFAESKTDRPSLSIAPLITLKSWPTLFGTQNKGTKEGDDDLSGQATAS